LALIPALVNEGSKMTPERWQQIDELLQETVKRPRRERAAFLDEVCADEANRREVESLISFHDHAENFLEVPAFEAAAGSLENQGESLVGLTVGPYRIESLLGAGGMGEVYLAEDTKLDRRVAIKFLPADLEADEVANGACFEKQEQRPSWTTQTSALLTKSEKTPIAAS
jgi:serine/threonine protein kinase